MPMYVPDTSVPSPEMLPPAMRGRATQKRVSSTSSESASRLIAADTTACLRAGVSLISWTSPISTFLYLILVLPASSPSAVLNEIAIIVPRSRIDLTTIHPPITAATSGSTHTSGSECCRRGCDGSASGMASRSAPCGASAMRSPFGLPDQAGIERHRSHHGQHHHRRECHRGRADAYRRDRLKIDQRDQQRHHEDVEHRPAAYAFDQAVQPVTPRSAPRGIEALTAAPRCAATVDVARSCRWRRRTARSSPPATTGRSPVPPWPAAPA